MVLAHLCPLDLMEGYFFTSLVLSSVQGLTLLELAAWEVETVGLHCGTDTCDGTFAVQGEVPEDRSRDPLVATVCTTAEIV